MAAILTLASLTLWSHWAVQCTCPGITKKFSAVPGDADLSAAAEQARIATPVGASKAAPIPDFRVVDGPAGMPTPNAKYCHQCMAVKPARAHHCSVAGACVMHLDHYCPWTNNSIGRNNQKFFIQFIIYVFFGSLYTGGLGLWRAWQCWSGSAVADLGVPLTRGAALCGLPLGTAVTCIISTVLMVFFAVFVGAMASDQYEAVTTDTTGIEAMKGWAEKSRSLMAGLTDVFGEPFSWRWFLPIQIGRASFYEWTNEMRLNEVLELRDPQVSDSFYAQVSEKSDRVDPALAAAIKRGTAPEGIVFLSWQGALNVPVPKQLESQATEVASWHVDTRTIKLQEPDPLASAARH